MYQSFYFYLSFCCCNFIFFIVFQYTTCVCICVWSFWSIFLTLLLLHFHIFIVFQYAICICNCVWSFYLYSLLPYLSLYFRICNRGELVRTADLSVAGQGDASGQLRLHKMRKSISIRHRSQTSTSAFLTFSSVVSRSTSIMSTALSTSMLVMSLVRAQEWLDDIRNLLMIKGMNRFSIYEKKHCIEFFPVIHVLFLDQYERGLHLESNQRQPGYY